MEIINLFPHAIKIRRKDLPLLNIEASPIPIGVGVVDQLPLDEFNDDVDPNIIVKLSELGVKSFRTIYEIYGIGEIQKDTIYLVPDNVAVQIALKYPNRYKMGDIFVPSDYNPMEDVYNSITRL